MHAPFVGAAAPLPCLSPASLGAAVPGCREPALWVEPLREACARYGIGTPKRLAMFVAQIGHESGDFRHLTEDLNYTPERLLAVFPSRVSPAAAQRLGRRDGRPADQEGIANLVYGKRLGNVLPGDGWLYRGAGLVQLTGFDNHDACAVEFGLQACDAGDWLRTARGAALSAAWFFAKRAGVLTAADAGLVDRVSRLVNGGDNGLEDRRLRYARAAKAFGA